MVKKLSAQATTFFIIGGVGFVIDGAVLTLLSVLMGVNVYGSRLISFALASLATWLLNRTHTFSRRSERTSTSPTNEYVRYAAVQAGGAVINLGIFSWLVASNPTLHAVPIVPLAAGAGVALIFNFLGAKFWVFRS